MRLVVARVGRPHGIRGEVTVEVRTDVPEERFVTGAVLRVTVPGRSASGGGLGVPASGRRSGGPGAAPGLPTTLTVLGARDHNGILLLTFAGVADRTAAEGLRGALLEVDVSDEPDEPDEPDAWYDYQLVGMRAEAPEGTVLGQVAAVEHAPAQDLLVIRRPDGVERLVPFVGAIVPTVDVDQGRLVVVDPGGLLTDPDEF
jgi:16S rRNA processing protein RimM